MRGLANTDKGGLFRDRVQAYLKARYDYELTPELPIYVGFKHKKLHRFDLGSLAPEVLVECKHYTWTATGNSPSAKLAHLNEAVLYFWAAPSSFRKLLFLAKSAHPSKGETLRAHWLRRYGHLLPSDLEVWEYDPTSQKAERLA